MEAGVITAVISIGVMAFIAVLAGVVAVISTVAGFKKSEDEADE